MKLHVYYHMAKRSLEEIDTLADMWLEDFKDISADVFIDACKLHRRSSSFLPTGKDILERCSDVWEERRRKIKKLPEPIPDLSPEEIKENVKRVRKVIKNAAGPLPKKEGGMKNSLKERVKERLDKYKRKSNEQT